MTRQQRTRQRAQRHYERHGDRRTTGTSTSAGRTHVRLNADTCELATLLLWQETNVARFSTLASAVNGMLRLILNNIREHDPSFEGFEDAGAASEYLRTYVTNNAPMQFQISVPQHTPTSKGFTKEQLDDFARIDTAVAQGRAPLMAATFVRTQESIAAPSDDEPLSDEELRNLGSDGRLRPYVSRVEPPAPDIAMSHETYDSGAV